MGDFEAAAFIELFAIVNGLSSFVRIKLHWLINVFYIQYTFKPFLQGVLNLFVQSWRAIYWAF